MWNDGWRKMNDGGLREIGQIKQIDGWIRMKQMDG